jgi:ribosomal protein S18 acetylase RimI-like enzyme
MTDPIFHPLNESNVRDLLTLMSELYSHQHMKFDEDVATSAVRALLGDGSLGRIYLIYSGDTLAGYFALTFCFSLEFHGRFGLLDELYVRERCRGQGLGRRAEALATTICKDEGLSALRLEVGKDNTAAESLYSRLGFNVEARKLMTKWL